MKNNFFISNLVRYFAVMLTPILVLGGFLYGLISIHLTNIIARNNEFALKQTTHISRMIFQTFDTANLLISSDSRHYMSLQRMLSSSMQTGSTDIENIRMLSNSINSIIALSPYIDSINIFMDQADSYYSSSHGALPVSHEDEIIWMENIRALNRESGFSSRKIYRRFEHDKDRNFISVYRRIFAWSGTAVVNINLDVLQKEMSEYLLYGDQLMLLTDGYTLLPLANAGILASEDEETLLPAQSGDTISLHGVSYLVHRIEMDSFGWNFLSAIPVSSIGRVQADIMRVIILVVAGCLLVSAAIAYRISRSNVRNISAILKAFDFAERGEEMPLLYGRGADQYNEIIRNIIRNGVSSQTMKLQITEKKYMLQTLELTALRYQINPHFVANTLKTIYWKSVESGGMDSSLSVMIENFLDVTYYALSTGGKQITLADEISRTKSFCDIITQRHADECEVLWDYPDQVPGIPCLKLILQPYVENAFYHGIHPAKDLKQIRLRFRIRDGTLHIQITNTGIGMDRETLRTVWESLKREEIPDRHIGIYNPHRRIQLAYGDIYGVTIVSKRSYGTCVLIRFPAT